MHLHSHGMIIIIILHTSNTILLQFGCCSNAYLNVGTLCGVTSEECELNAVGMSPDSGNQLEVMNGGVSAVLHSTVGIFISMIFAGLALIF